MTFNALLHFGAALFCAGLACFVVVRDRRSFVHRIFAFGMVVLGVEALFTGLSLQGILPEDVARWQRWRWAAGALLPGSWLIFSLSFPLGDWKSALKKWKWAIVATFLIPLSFATIFAPYFFRDVPLFDPFDGWLVSLDWSGYLFHIFFLASVVVIIMLFERTLRASKGRQRWQVKFLAVGIGAFLAARIYTGSQVLLLHGLHLDLEIINAAALLVANVLILVSISRARFLSMDIYLSQTMLYHSVTLLIVGGYLLAVAAVAKASGAVNGGLALPLRAFFVFLAFLLLTIVLLSDRLRLKMKQHISRHLRKPRYDYRNAWIAFTKRTASLVEKRAFCDAVVKMVSEMLDIPSVSLWLLDERKAGLRLGGSTVFTEAQARDLPEFRNGALDLIQLMRNQRTFVDVEGLEVATAEDFKGSRASFLKEARIRYCIPVVTGADFLGIITVGNRVGGEPFSFEELDMLKTIGDQVAASLLNLKLSEQLQQAKEMEAFQTVSALFVHDLKNLASKLSLLLQNFPAHYDNPEFREDALRTMSQSVEQINNMCRRLYLVRNSVKVSPVESDLNEVVANTLAGLDGLLKGSLIKTLHPVPRVSLDPEQIPKVLTNLVLNASEAAGEGGEIHVTTGTRDGSVVLTVSDNGCGMSREFVDQCLFRPFNTTKKQGTGIGLFHSRMIVDAHKRQIEVESQEDKGSLFRVLLPVRGA